MHLMQMAFQARNFLVQGADLLLPPPAGRCPAGSLQLLRGLVEDVIGDVAQVERLPVCGSSGPDC